MKPVVPLIKEQQAFFIVNKSGNIMHGIEAVFPLYDMVF